MAFAVDIQFETHAVADATREAFLINWSQQPSLGVEALALSIQPVLGAKKSAFALRISFEFALGVASGVAGNAIYETIKETLATRSDPPPAVQPQTQPSLPIIRVDGREIQLHAQAITEAIERLTSDASR